MPFYHLLLQLSNSFTQSSLNFLNYSLKSMLCRILELFKAWYSSCFQVLKDITKKMNHFWNYLSPKEDFKSNASVLLSLLSAAELAKTFLCFFHNIHFCWRLRNSRMLLRNFKENLTYFWDLFSWLWILLFLS